MSVFALTYIQFGSFQKFRNVLDLHVALYALQSKWNVKLLPESLLVDLDKMV